MAKKLGQDRQDPLAGPLASDQDGQVVGITGKPVNPAFELSADFCFLPPDVSARKAERGTSGAGGLSTPFGMVRSPVPIILSPRGKQISPDKTVSFPCTARIIYHVP
jgi:hypothetical protein